VSYRIVVGLPSWNENETIAQVARDLDAALASLPFEHDAVIVNADNSSDDGTPAIFMSTNTRYRKHVLGTPPRGGKGANWRAILDFAKAERATAVLFVDSDLAEVPEAWVHALVNGVRDGLDFCYPLRPPTWNGGDLTYHLAYPLLAGIFGADLREPLCGDIAVSADAVADLTAQQWQPDEMRFGVDFLAASVAVARKWGTVQLAIRRRNKLRSFSLTPDEDYRMGDKFFEVSAVVGYRCAVRLRQEPPKELQPATGYAPTDPEFIVPSFDADVAALAVSTARRLRVHAQEGGFAAFTSGLDDRLTTHALGTGVSGGMGWDLWRSCLFEWISQLADGRVSVDPELLETLFLSRVVGHHRQIAGSPGWYQTVLNQATDAFRHRHTLWRHVTSSAPGV
jgi:hypothetical protein